uniref:Kisspeptin n=2 Tax=Cynoglossus semilaevis TaxID=244447 RepID=A0A5A4CYT5_CYNSE|nr:kisspeptin [Cynoglossus semilaevis]
MEAAVVQFFPSTTVSIVLSAVRRSGAAAAAAAAADFLAEQESGSSSGLCFSLRENDERRQLLCNDRRSKFNFNPFGLRFGKRYIYRRAVARARTNKFSPLSVFSRELEVAT